MYSILQAESETVLKLQTSVCFILTMGQSVLQENVGHSNIPTENSEQQLFVLTFYRLRLNNTALN